MRFLALVGLDYLTLDRRANTLSGGESQRIRLATQIGTRLTGVMYVLDEPSIGLHPHDNARLLSTLRELTELGNTLIVVEHDEEAIKNADHIIDIGPKAGIHGGQIVTEGNFTKIMKSKFNVTNEKALKCRFHVQTGGSTLSAQEIDNNIVRTTIQALSAILGGAQSLHTNSRDEALSLPTDESAKLALRTQQIIAYESGITNHPDPFGGSYVIEKMTDTIEKDAYDIIKIIENKNKMEFLTSVK